MTCKKGNFVIDKKSKLDYCIIIVLFEDNTVQRKFYRNPYFLSLLRGTL